MAEDREIAGEDRPKVYLETSFMFYLTGRETTDQKIASEQAYTRKWWEEERSRCRCHGIAVTLRIRRLIRRRRKSSSHLA